MSHSSSVVFNDLTFTWPDGSTVLTNLKGAFSCKTTGLIGANGAGKSTLLKLISGQLKPTAGTVSTRGLVDYLPQDVTTTSATVADLLGIDHIRAALRAVEAGSVDQADFDRIGDNWDIESRAVAVLAALHLPADLDRTVSELSGGEAMLTAIAGVRLRGADIALLDEPTNNLDRPARECLYDLVRTWPGTLIVVSHDLELLDLLEETAELRAGSLTIFGGNYTDYRDWLTVQQAAAEQSLRSAENVLKREKQERIKAEERIAHSQRQGRKDRENRKYVGMIVDKRRNAAEKTQGAKRTAADARVQAAQAAVDASELLIRDDDVVQFDLVDPKLPTSKHIVTLPSSDGRHYDVRGPERLGIVGTNGVGKTRLIERVLPDVKVACAYLPQQIEFDADLTVLEAVCQSDLGISPGELRNRLARLLIRGDMVDRHVQTLSGGERLRVALAKALVTDVPPGLLILDEPTNNLDVSSIEQLVAALGAYRGALLVVSHDVRFLRQLDLSGVLCLEADGRLVPESLEQFGQDAFAIEDPRHGIKHDDVDDN
ncbi:MAG: ABC-F family ATP-binding cassette domain-containing protein [Aeromicrobium sp.]|nr:MAG: ABC-F family ATP-binding cassette domain-containing protein [Aeromicrobium sp.]